MANNGMNKLEEIPLFILQDSKRNYGLYQIKKFHKTDHPKVEILIQNTILKFSKTKNQTKKPLKFQKIKNIYMEASNQKVL